MSVRYKNLFQNIAIVIISIVLTFAAIEIYLRMSALTDFPLAPIEVLNNPSREIPKELIDIEAKRLALLNMPVNWNRRAVQIQGAKRAEYWHGALHTYDDNGFRLSAPIPPKKEGVYRILIVGDSLAYGYGIDERFRFSNLLESWLGKTRKIEVINLGLPGKQSTDILEIIRHYAPKLKPDRVLYAICLNDFLPSGARHEVNYYFPLPEEFKNYLISHFRLAALISVNYRKVLFKHKLIADFYEDILRKFPDYQKRFQSDVAEMNQFIMQLGLPPMMAIVLDQYPTYDARRQKLTRVAEKFLTEAGAELIPTEEYYKKYNEKTMMVSAWEGHPDEVANWIWATMIEKSFK